MNLPVRTLVLYSIMRGNGDGRPDALLARDIKNLVGRAGRAGSTTKGLVICANADQWPQVERVALEMPGEDMIGALRSLIERLYRYLAVRNLTLTNENLDASPSLYDLIDGIDSTLIDLAAEEITQEQLAQIAADVADRTFASRQIDERSKELLRQLFRLRVEKISSLRAAGHLGWVRETGAKARLIASVQADLLPVTVEWDSIQNPIDPQVVEAVFNWAWIHGGMEQPLRKAYDLRAADDIADIRAKFYLLVQSWLAGSTFAEIADVTASEVDDVLRVITTVLSYGLQTLAEQAIALLAKMLDTQGRTLPAAVLAFPECLRFGVSSVAAVTLAGYGIRHRRAAVLLAQTQPVQVLLNVPRGALLTAIRELLRSDETAWRNALGTLMHENTLADTV